MFQFQHIFAYEILKENFDKTFIITKNTKISTIGEESSERFMQTWIQHKQDILLEKCSWMQTWIHTNKNSHRERSLQISGLATS